MSKRSPRTTEDADTLVRYDAGEGDEALAPTVPALRPEGEGSFEDRYVAGPLLGEGGMGRVVTCLDQRIGREVALKIIQPDARTVPRLQARFHREARVQGQLEHPSIVPVYDLGVGPDGPYFTMRRVRGRTLAEILEALAAREAGDSERYSLHRLLVAFVQLSQAVAFAHARGVVHRDLKPSNVMLGDYGEVYVLDWGVAKHVGVVDPKVTKMRIGSPGDSETRAGEVVGTPGFMAPEQLLGEGVDARTDVYALGAILFEILTLEALHEEDADRLTIVEATLKGVEARPSVRAPERHVPPELEAICVRATELDPDLRYASAKELAEEVEAWLSGDRDLELRRELAATYVAAANEALSENDPDATGRSRAIADLNRAIALDPANDEALSKLASLLLSPSREIPDEVREAFAGEDHEERRYLARLGISAFSAWLLLSPLLLWPTIRSWPAALTCVGLLAIALGVCLYAHRKGRVSDAMGVVVLLLSSAAMGGLSLFLGPFVLVPALAAQNTVYFAAFATPGLRRALVVAVGTLPVIAPWALEKVGAIAPSMDFRDGTLRLLPRMMELPATATETLLLVGSVAMVALPCFILARLNDARLDLKLRLLSHVWHLGQLVPSGARPTGRPPPR